MFSRGNGKYIVNDRLSEALKNTLKISDEELFAKPMKSKEQKVYRETFEKLLRNSKTSYSKISKDMGYTSSWLSHKFDRGYATFTRAETICIMALLKCEENELYAIPVKNNDKKENDDAVENNNLNAVILLVDNLIRQSQELIEKTNSLIIDAAKMLHTDVRNLIETMDKYWKPEPPKYQVKDREQP